MFINSDLSQNSTRSDLSHGMGITSPTDLKPENSDPKSQNYQGPSEEPPVDSSSAWRDRFDVFMEEGGCKESYRAFNDCIDEDEEKCREALEKCMKTHAHYYEPVYVLKTVEEHVTKDLPSTVLEQTEEGDAKGEDEAEKLSAFIKGGGCKETFRAYFDNCTEEDGEKNKDVTKCAGLFSMMNKCVDAHGYSPAMKSAEDHLVELKALFSQKQAEG